MRAPLVTECMHARSRAWLAAAGCQPLAGAEMPPRNRALGDGGAGQVHGQASVRLEPLASGRDATGPRGGRGKSLAQP